MLVMDRGRPAPHDEHGVVLKSLDAQEARWWPDAESTDEFRIVLCSVCVFPVRGVGLAFRTSFVPPPTQLPDDATMRSMPETFGVLMMQ